MRTYKEYYNLGMEHHLDWLSHQKRQWWKDKDMFDYRSIKGDYIETVKFLTDDEKNDASLFHNHTNVKNSEWGILFSMLGQALVDWCVENVDWKNLWSFGIEIERTVVNLASAYSCKFSVEKYDFDKNEWVKEEDKNELSKFEGCKDFLLNIVEEFIASHRKNIPNDWNYFSFGLDSLMDSCKWREWVCSSDGYMNLGNYNKESDDYTCFVECM